jgi:hypothetical protein
MSRVLSYERVWVYLVIQQSLIGNGSISIFPRQQTIVEGVVHYTVHVISKKVGGKFLPELLVFFPK